MRKRRACENAGNGAAAMFAMFCLVSLSLSLPRSVCLSYVRLLVRFYPFLNEAFVLVHASKLIKEFNTVNLLGLVETLRMQSPWD